MLRLAETIDGAFMVNPSDHMGSLVCAGTRWEPWVTKALGQYVDPKKNCIDVGANFGYHTVGMAKRTDGVVYAFEPQRKIFMQLVSTITANELLDKVFPVQAAVSNAAGKTRLSKIYITNEYHNSGDVYLDPTNETGEEVMALFLDGVEDELGPVGLIKIDVQGQEMFVLVGAENIIKHQKPTILIELEEDMAKRSGVPIADIKAKLEGWGYTLIKIGEDTAEDYVAVPS